jgi:ankyrin repeat protein
VRALIAGGADFNATIAEGATALILAAYNGQHKDVKVHLENGADVDAQDNYGMTALMFAARNGHAEVVQELIAGGADVNATMAEEGVTALMFAARNGHVNVVSELIGRHADIMVKNKYGETVVMCAAKSGHVAVVRELLTQRSDNIGKMEETYCGHGRVWVVAPQPGHNAETIKAAINLRDNKGGTALIYAAKNGNAEIVKMLLRYWPDLDARLDGKKAHQWAAAWEVANGNDQLNITRAIMLARVQRGL